MTGIAHLPAMGPVTSATIGTPTFATDTGGRNPAPLGRKNNPEPGGFLSSVPWKYYDAIFSVI